MMYGLVSRARWDGVLSNPGLVGATSAHGRDWRKMSSQVPWNPWNPNHPAISPGSFWVGPCCTLELSPP